MTNTEQVKVLCGRMRDIGLAAYDGVAAADAILAMAETLHGASTAGRRALLIAEGDRLVEYGTLKGSNVHLVAAIAVRRATLQLASTPDEIGYDQNLLGNALSDLGARESGTARLEEAVAAYRAALEERTRAANPQAWATTQNNLGAVLAIIAERSGDRGRMAAAAACARDAVAVFREAGASHYLAVAEETLAKAKAALAKMP